ncbi:MAG: hypothetical protein OXF74_07165 [Rhodobacteraceae bacterium]|nr:hypothetical protein [Paracoccaceae bacterium]
MTSIVPRTCHEVTQSDFPDRVQPPSQSIEEWENHVAYVLLGLPGSGKTTIFKHEAQRQGVTCVTVRDFLAFDDRPEWHKETLFIDGLDEARSRAVDGLTPLDQILAKLDRIGCPRFRLSCREADWFGSNDVNRLRMVSPDPDRTVTVLRLDPLSDDDVRQLLSADAGFDYPDDFMSSAREKGLQGLLSNPQSLKMLVKAVGPDGVWPKTRMQAFDMACRALLAEHNEDHSLAQPDRESVADLITACGRLFAVQLLTGAAGYIRCVNEEDTDFLGPDRLPGMDRKIISQCLQSKLFEAPASCRASPIHRQIAEFLAAGYLADLIQDGLPVERVLALMTGHDGVIVSEFRGLSAWLAAHCKCGRAAVIARDPLGTILYGDVSDFSLEERNCLLRGLHREVRINPGNFVRPHLDSRLGDLVSSDLEERFHEILAASDRDESWQSLVIVLLEALRHGECLPQLASVVKELILDGTRRPRLRVPALKLYLRHFRKVSELKEFAAALYTGKAPDPDDDLLGILLSELYPDEISETEVIRYLKIPRMPDYYGAYRYFWTVRLLNESAGSRLAVLLDHFVARYDELLADQKALGLLDSFVPQLHAPLLSRFLQSSDDQTDLTRLFDWLDPVATSFDRDYSPETGYEYREVRQWLIDHPDIWKALMAEGLRKCIDRYGHDKVYGIAYCMNGVEHGRLLAVTRPPDFGLWCLDQAITVSDADAADWLLEQIAGCLREGCFNEGLAYEDVSKRLAGDADLKCAFDRKAAQLETAASEVTPSRRHSRTHLKTEKPNWYAHVKPHEDELRGNKASPELLHQLAKVYFGGYLNLQGNLPRERLGSLLDDDSSLIEAVLAGFRRTADRGDLPTDRQVIRLGATKQTHYLALPFLAGLEEEPLPEPSDERLLRLALAINYTVPAWPGGRYSAGLPRGLHKSLLSKHTQLAADVLIQSVLSELRSGAASPFGVAELARSSDHAGVASISALHLLQRFPIRCTSDQLSSLSHLMLAARRHCREEQLLELIDGKHSHPGMTVAQRIYWLVCGLCIDPKTYVDRLGNYAAVTQRRIRFLAEAVANQLNRSSDLRVRQSVPALRLLIRLIGVSCRPHSFDTDSDEGTFVTPAMEAAGRVRRFINQLASISSEDAFHALEELASDTDLRPWQELLMDAVSRQSALRRETGFIHGDVEQVLATLACGTPANAADLAALIVEHLHQLARKIRDGSTSDWRQYWNVDGRAHIQKTRPENVCRDALASDLKARLQPLGVDVLPEGAYTDAKRADIRVSIGEFNVPIEVKKSCSRDLWSALRSQLINQYVRDPGTGGYGIYLVLWFGNAKDCTPASPITGPLPVDAQDLGRRLRSTLSEEEKFRIRICVVDVAAPN